MIQRPALLVLSSTGVLRYWPMQARGAEHPQRIAKIAGGITLASSMAANGDLVVVSSLNPPMVALYNVRTRQQTTLTDPSGKPEDVAIDRQGNIFALNFTGYYSDGNVTMYQAPSWTPVELDCSAIGNGEDAIAVDNEGDLFISTNDGDQSIIVEFPNASGGLQSNNCTTIGLAKQAYSAGLVVDPKTDDLVRLSNPGFCAGGVEGLMTIYPKPYRERTRRSVRMHGNCAGKMRLSADSTRVFFVDAAYAQLHGRGRRSEQGTLVRQRSYPEGKWMGEYRGGSPWAITTIPNRLPN
jgi:hypothetical protein